MTNPWGASPGDARNWYAADLGITTVSGKVSVWANQGTTGSADDAAQSTAGLRPTYVASHTPNSKPAVRFDSAAGTYMQTPNFGSSVGGANTFFIVFQPVHPTGVLPVRPGLRVGGVSLQRFLRRRLPAHGR